MPIASVSRQNARFGYGLDGTIFEIADPLPEPFWAHPAQSWSPLIKTRIPRLAGTWLKYEGSHLSGSFKDRIMAVSIAELVARDPNCSGVVVPSSGNAAVSAATLCARSNLKMVAIVPLSVPVERLRPILARGGLVMRAGEGPSQSYALADSVSAALSYAKLYSTFASPWAEWGCRSLGRELAGQMQSPITHLVSPVSAGPVLVGAANGLVEAGLARPVLVAVQAAGCAPIARAFASGAALVEPWTDSVATRAAAIADRLDGYAQDGTHVLDAVRASGGAVAAVTDDELEEARAALLRHDGIDAELSACAGIAHLLRSPNPPPAGTVCIITASGFKHTFAGDVPGLQPNPVMADRLRALLPQGAPGEVLG